MGFIAKKNTERKAAPATGPLGIAVENASWRATGRVTAGAIVREAALGLNLTSKYSNINRAGHSNRLASGIAGAITSVDTVLWMKELGPKAWQVTLGAATIDGHISVDWQCEVHIRPSEVELRTPQYFTRDGNMIHAKLHDQFRATVLEQMALGTTRAPGDGAALSRHTLARAGVGDVISSAGKCDDKFQAISSRPLEEVASNLANGTYGFPLIENGENRWRYGLGLPVAWSENWVEVILRTDNAGGTIVDGTISLGGAGSRAVQIVATRSATASWRLFSLLLKSRDQNVVLEPPTRIAVS